MSRLETFRGHVRPPRQTPRSMLLEQASASRGLHESAPGPRPGSAKPQVTPPESQSVAVAQAETNSHCTLNKVCAMATNRSHP